jgi:hypothetical protein
MNRRRGGARCAALLVGLFAAGIAHAACIAVASSPDGERVAAVSLPAQAPVFTVTYVHSVTRTPVEERYRVDGDAIVETEIRFEQHGPGLPTEPDAGERWTRLGDRYVVTLNRRFLRVVMRIDAETRPTLSTDGQRVDLAQWGSRSLELKPIPEPCTQR